MRGEMKRISPKLRSFAARLRGNQTDAEQRLWERIRDGQIKEWKFRRQHPIGRYIVDFCCLEGMLIIELDDRQPVEQEEADFERTKYLSAVGFHVLRFWNDDVLTKTDDVLEEILRVLEGSDDFHSHPSGFSFEEKANCPISIMRHNTHSIAQADFAEADLSNVLFDSCDLEGTIFERTILKQADFRTSYNYSIDPE